MLAFSDSFGLNGLIEDWLNRDRTNHGLVMYTTETVSTAIKNVLPSTPTHSTRTFLGRICDEKFMVLPTCGELRTRWPG